MAAGQGRNGHIFSSSSIILGGPFRRTLEKFSFSKLVGKIGLFVMNLGALLHISELVVPLQVSVRVR